MEASRFGWQEMIRFLTTPPPLPSPTHHQTSNLSFFLHKCSFWAQLFFTWQCINCDKISKNFTKFLKLSQNFPKFLQNFPKISPHDNSNSNKYNLWYLWPDLCPTSFQCDAEISLTPSFDSPTLWYQHVECTGSYAHSTCSHWHPRYRAGLILKDHGAGKLQKHLADFVR